MDDGARSGAPDGTPPHETRWEPDPAWVQWPAAEPPAPPPAPPSGYPSYPNPAVGYPQPRAFRPPLSYPPPIPQQPALYPTSFGYPHRRRLRSGEKWLIAAAMVVALAVTGGLAARTVLPSRPPVDHSGVVRIADPRDLPAPLVTAREFPVAGFEETGAPLRAAPTGLGSDAFVFQRTGAFGRPVTWSPCRPIHFVVNPSGAPAGFEAQVLSAVGAVSAATGLVFTYDGRTDEPIAPDRPAFQPARYGDRWAPLLIAFADSRTVPDLAEQVLGIAEVYSVTDRYSGVPRYVSGNVYLDTEILRYRSETTLYFSVLLHELGHVAGLGHVDDPDQLMFETTNYHTSFQDGDLAGLAELGRGGCAPGV